MLPKIKNILYATDLSESARHAFSYAALLADSLHAEIAVLHVLEEIPASSKSQLIDYMGEETWNSLRELKRSDFQETIRGRLEDFCKEAGEELTECRNMVRDMLIREGNPSVQILEEMERGDYDMLVIGTHGHGALADALMGGTARRVVRRCAKPVTVVRLPD